MRLKQKVEAVEVVAAWASTQGFGDGFETANQYQLKDLRYNPPVAALQYPADPSNRPHRVATLQYSR